MYYNMRYTYHSKRTNCTGELYQDKMTIYDPDGNIIYQVDWHCGEDWYSKECCRIRTEDYPMLLQRLKKLEEDIKDEFGIDG
jgi:hypothetical protein